MPTELNDLLHDRHLASWTHHLHKTIGKTLRTPVVTLSCRPAIAVVPIILQEYTGSSNKGLSVNGQCTNISCTAVVNMVWNFVDFLLWPISTDNICIPGIHFYRIVYLSTFVFLVGFSSHMRANLFLSIGYIYVFSSALRLIIPFSRL